MDTQPEMAVADAVAPDAQPVVPANETTDAADFYRDQPQADAEPAPQGDEGGEGEQEGGDPDPIAAPLSWAKDAKETFASLPREAQEIIAKRETEREQFVQSKAREASQTRNTVETEARGVIQQMMQNHASQLEQYAGQFNVAPPDVRLLQSADPAHHAAYYEQDRQYRIASAQRETLSQQAQQARQQADGIAAQEREQSIAAENAILAEKVPEWSDPSERAKFLGSLEPIAAELGYPQELMAQAGATDILALRQASGWKAKADKYDQLMKQRMEPVRAAKQIPPNARAGAPTGQSQPIGTAELLYPNDVRR